MSADDETAPRELLLEVRDLHVRYAGAVQALRGVSIDVPEGTVTAVLGNNGAGKTTLLRAISGTLRPRQGTITFAGRNLAGSEPADIARSGLVQVPEGRRIFGHLTVEENLRAGGLAARDKATRATARARVDELFPILRERHAQRAGLLSGGEQQMLAIGRALMADPRVLLLDEPSLGLAPRIVEQLREVIAEINRQGVTVVLVEQNAAMALAVADRAVVLEVGRVALEGTAAELRESDEVRNRYLGIAPAALDAPAPRGGDPRSSERATGSSERGDGAAARELVVDNLTVRFGGISALSEVSFAVEPGTMHALIGPNGAGKSTCLNVLSGVYPSSAGSVRYGGQELTRSKPHRIAALGVSRTFQNIALSPTATVLDNLLVARHRHMRSGFIADGLRLPRARRERAQNEARVKTIAALLDLDVERLVGTLSYGTRKRVELARALCAEPGLLLLDEPVAGMVHDESMAMAHAIAGARAELGISVLLVEHDMAFVMGIADRVTVLDFGKRIADGTPTEIQNDPEVLRAYLGGGGVNQFVTLLIGGLFLGAIYSLVALGFVTIFRATGVINFAQGSMLLLGAYVIGRTHETIGFLAAVLLGILVAAIAAALIDIVLIRRVRTADLGTLAILTLGVDILLLTELTRRIGTDVLSVGAPWGSDVVEVAGIRVASSRVIAGGVALLLVAGFAAAFKYTDWGVAMRSAAEDGETASLMGIRLNRVAAAAWGLAGALAAIGGLFLTSFPAAGVTGGVGLVALAAIPAVVLGGFDSPGGAVVGGLIIGVVSVLTAGYQEELSFLGRGLGTVAPFAVMLLVLLVRPSGLFGTREVTRV